MKSGESYQRNRIDALQAWAHIVGALNASDQPGDHELAQRISSFIVESAFAKEHGRKRQREVPAQSRWREGEPVISGDRPGPDFNR